MNIWQRTKEALQPLGVPMAQNRYVSDTPGALPELFLTYILVSAPQVQAADNNVTVRRYRMQVNTYSCTGMSAMPDVESAMRAAGFTAGDPLELPYNEKTGHFGLAQDFFFFE